MVKNYELISAPEARRHVQAGEALLVCAYDNEEKFRNAFLEGAIPVWEFKARVEDLSPDKEIIFYCSWPANASSASLAEKVADMGFRNVKVLNNGTKAWKEEGYPFML